MTTEGEKKKGEDNKWDGEKKKGKSQLFNSHNGVTRSVEGVQHRSVL